MDLGQALSEADKRLDGDSETAEEAAWTLAWLKKRRQEFPILDWPLENFLKIPREDQLVYLNTYRENEPDEPEWETDPPKILEILSELAQEPVEKGKRPATTQVGDKWMSPGRLVCSWPDLDPTARLVMFVMAAHGDNKGENIWISQSKIAYYLGMSKRTVQRAMGRLEGEKAISMTAEPRQHKPPTWCLNQGPGVT